MEYNEAKKRELLASLKECAFESNPINNSKIDEISIELKTIPSKEKNKFYDFVKFFLDEGFKLGLGESNIKLEDFENSIIEDTITSQPKTEIVSESEYNEIIIKEIITEEIDSNKSIISFEDLFQKIRLHLKDYLEFYKGYYVLKLQNDPTKKFKLIFLYDDNYFFELLQKKINQHFSNIEFIEIKSFKDNVSDYDENYLCVVLLNSKSNDKEGLKKLHYNLSIIINSFNDFDNYSFYKNTEDNSIGFKKSNVKDDFLDEINFVNKTFLSNYDMSFAEEKIIKKLCSVDTPLILYKILNKGFSGAKVLEIRPKVSASFDKEKKYIIKYDLLKNRKLKEEFENFDKNVLSLKGFNDYNGIYEKTLTHEGIRYNYAISDFSQESFSFNDIIKNSNNVFNSQKNDKIKKLFNISLFNSWKEEHFIDKKDLVENIFSRFININEIIKELEKVLGLNNEEILKNDLLINFNKIWNHKIVYKEKICHGDLHTDNFFIDENDIYLIDFGFTGKHHSLIDYTALECSLKFKHFPLYLESNELIKIEEELILDSTFNLNHNFSCTKRNDVSDILSMINAVRSNSIKDFSDGSNLDYFISLFIMTFRQIRYPNMNQLYAYHSAKILSNHIISQI